MVKLGTLPALPAPQLYRRDGKLYLKESSDRQMPVTVDGGYFIWNTQAAEPVDPDEEVELASLESDWRDTRYPIFSRLAAWWRGRLKTATKAVPSFTTSAGLFVFHDRGTTPPPPF